MIVHFLGPEKVPLSAAMLHNQIYSAGRSFCWSYDPKTEGDRAGGRRRKQMRERCKVTPGLRGGFAGQEDVERGGAGSR